MDEIHKQKNALIIGASSGIGRVLSEMLIAADYQIIATARREDMLISLKEKAPEKITIKVQDVTQMESNKDLFDYVRDTFDHLDLVVYSSGTGGENYTLDWMKEKETLDVNVMAATMIYGLAYNYFHEQGFGHLVGISSIASIRGNRHVPAYFASKAFQASYLESLYMKGRRSKADIYVTDIQPGFVDTAMAIGDTFWMATVEKATRQIFKAIQKRKRRVYITKRWALIAFVLKIVPTKLLYKFT